MQLIAREQRLRISFVSGDVHCAAVGLFKTLVKGKKAVDIVPEQDYRYMINVTTSESLIPAFLIFSPLIAIFVVLFLQVPL